MNPNSILRTENLGISFGGLKAVSNFSIEIGDDQLIGLIGPNGAGKTTVFNLLSGVYRPTEGQIYLEGKPVSVKHPHQMVRRGVTRTFQNIRLFKEMTVIENIKSAINMHMKYSIPEAILRLPRYFQEEAEIHQEALDLLRVFDMEEYADHHASNLPYGRQRKLEIARALATKPKLLLLDEPAAGMNPTETAELMTTIATLRESFDLSILLIEHDMNLVMGICEEIIVIDYGTIIAKGTPDEIRKDANVIGAYLGE